MPDVFDEDSAIAIALRERLTESRGNRIQFCLSLLAGSAFLETPGHNQETRGAVQLLRTETHWRPEVSLIREKIEILRHDANDRRLFAIDHHGLTQNRRRTTEAAEPQAMAKNRDLGPVPVLIFFLRE